jgi:hypothetical protein
MKKIDSIELLELAQKKKQQTYLDGETNKKGQMRGGNAGFTTLIKGVYTPVGGDSQCPRIIHLRVDKGIQMDTETLVKIEKAGGLTTNISSKNLMFDGGLANETVWEERLKSVLPEGFHLLCEEDLKLLLNLPNGILFSGRPDQVICEVDPTGESWLEKDGVKFVPKTVLEHKGAYSVWTARTVLFLKKPKLLNVIQAATYGYLIEQLNQGKLKLFDQENSESPTKESDSINEVEDRRITTELIYTNYDNFLMNDILQRICPSYGEPGSEWISYRFKKLRLSNRSPKGYTYDEVDESVFKENQHVTQTVFDKQKKKSLKLRTYVAEAGFVRPFVVGFNVRVCHDSTIEWKQRDSHEWNRTGIKMEDVWRTYEMAASLRNPDAPLPPRPVMLDAHMKPESYDGCHYCPLKKACDSFKGKTAGEWDEHAIRFINESEEK